LISVSYRPKTGFTLHRYKPKLNPLQIFSVTDPPPQYLNSSKVVEY